MLVPRIWVFKGTWLVDFPPVFVREATFVTVGLLSCTKSSNEKGSTITAKNLLPFWAAYFLLEFTPSEFSLLFHKLYCGYYGRSFQPSIICLGGLYMHKYIFNLWHLLLRPFFFFFFGSVLRALDFHPGDQSLDPINDLDFFFFFSAMLYNVVTALVS